MYGYGEKTDYFDQKWLSDGKMLAFGHGGLVSVAAEDGFMYDTGKYIKAWILKKRYYRKKGKEQLKKGFKKGRGGNLNTRMGVICQNLENTASMVLRIHKIRLCQYFYKRFFIPLKGSGGTRTQCERGRGDKGKEPWPPE